MVFMSGAFRLNERLTLQQGTFLITGDICKSFQNNLYADEYPSDGSHVKKCVIAVDRELKENIAKELGRMNINNAVLFPGLDGFSQSLWRRVGLKLEDKVLVDSKDLILYP